MRKSGACEGGEAENEAEGEKRGVERLRARRAERVGGGVGGVEIHVGRVGLDRGSEIKG